VRGDLFVEDGLHLNRAGYELWKSVIAPALR
jgi:lysophospholipase L1-like esterase